MAKMAKTAAKKKTKSRQKAQLHGKAADAVQAQQKIPTGGEKVVQCLEREGVEIIFGLPGGAAIPLFDALIGSKIKLVRVRHEQGATHMADGYARATGKPGVVLVTSGPGATNTITGLYTALMDSVPMVVITAQVVRSLLGKDAFQEADMTGITYPVVKHSYLVRQAADIPRIMKEPFYIATSGRPGPVLVDMPKDLAAGPCDAPFVDSVDLPGYHVPHRAEVQDLKRAAQFLGKSRRPVLYVGHGAVISDAGRAILELAEKLQARGCRGPGPIPTTPRARSGSAVAPRDAWYARHCLRQQGGG